jgi:hypothetical protein
MKQFNLQEPVGPPRLLEFVVVVGMPLLLAVTEVFHPHPHDLLNVDVHTWMAVHYAQIPLFPLSALAVITLLRGRSDAAAIISRIAMFVFAVSYVAFDTCSGSGNGYSRAVRPCVRDARGVAGTDRGDLDTSDHGRLLFWPAANSCRSWLSCVVSRRRRRRCLSEARRLFLASRYSAGAIQLWNRYLCDARLARRATDIRRSSCGWRLAARRARPCLRRRPIVEDELLDESLPLSATNSAPER